MATDFTFNVALGREVEFYNRVNGNDPANSALVLVVLALAGIEDDDDLKQYETLAALLAGASAEVTNVGYAREVLTDADLAAYTIDHVRGRIVPALPLVTFTTPAVGDTWEKVLVCYDPDTTGGTDADMIPITAHVLRYQNAPVIPNGDDIIVNLTAGFCQAQ